MTSLLDQQDRRLLRVRALTDFRTHTITHLMDTTGSFAVGLIGPNLPLTSMQYEDSKTQGALPPFNHWRNV